MLYYYTTVAQNTKGGRIWIEGDTLRRAGFKPSSRYRLKYTEEGLELLLSKKGERLVSKRTRSQMVFPIIDINNNKILEIFEADTPIICSIDKKRIKISTHFIKELQKDREARFLDKIKNNKKLDDSALFCGGGISAHAIKSGLNKKGVKTNCLALAELDASYLQIAERNLKPDYVYKSKIEDINIADIKKTDILSFSMPCTGHSSHGKASNKIKMAEEHSEANTSLFGVVNYVINSNPAVLISENVIQAQNSATYILLKAELRRLKYKVYEFNLDHSQAGSVEKRKRYWFVAVSENIDKTSPFSKIETPVYKKRYKTINELLETREDEKWMPLNYFNKRLDKNIKNGRNFTTSFVKTDDSETNVIPRNYTKRQISNPHLEIDGKLRLFNPVEHSRIKGVPEELVEGVSDTKAHEILGQAILYNHAKGIGEMIGELVSNIKDSQ